MLRFNINYKYKFSLQKIRTKSVKKVKEKCFAQYDNTICGTTEG